MTEKLNKISEVTLSPEHSAALLAVMLETPEGVNRKIDDRKVVLDHINDVVVPALMEDEVLMANAEAMKNGESTILIVRGLPVDPELPGSPLDGKHPDGKKTFVSEAVGLGLTSLVAFPSMMFGEKDGDLVHQITPVAKRERTQSNEGQVDLQAHQDLAPIPYEEWRTYHDIMPDYLILTGLRRGDQETYTFISNVDDAIAEMDEEYVSILMEDRFTTDPPDSFKKEKPDGFRDVPSHAVLNEFDGYIESCFDISSKLRPVDPEDEKAAEALVDFHEKLLDVKQEVLIEPGMAVIFCNRRVVHGRGRVAGESTDADKRWIQRVYSYDVSKFTRRMLSGSSINSMIAGPGFLTARSPANVQRLEREMQGDGLIGDALEASRRLDA